MATTDPIAGLANVSPNPWPGECAADPNDFDLYAPRGNGVFGAGSGPYGHQPQSTFDPVANGPSTDPCEGSVAYFETVRLESIQGLLETLGIEKHYPNPSRQYAVFHKRSDPFGAGGFYNQLRIVDTFGLRFLFRAIDEEQSRAFPEQPHTIPELITGFVQAERSRYGSFTSGGTEESIGGTGGGDGNYAIEGLSFGLMVENGYHQVYRVWSRCWLVTK